MGPKAKKICVDPPSMVKRICGATGCGLEVRGCDLARHYKNRTDFNLLKKMNNMSSKAAEKELETADMHTAYMFVNKHSEKNLPKWNLHKPVKKSAPKVFQLIGHKDDPNQNISKDGDQLDNGRKENESSSSSESDNEDTSTSKRKETLISLNPSTNLTPPVPGLSLTDESSGDETERETNMTEVSNNSEGARINTVRKEIKTVARNMFENDEDLEAFAEKVAEKIFLKFKEEEQRKLNETENIEETWIEGDTMYQCRPCLKYSQSAFVPKRYFKFRKNNFGVLEKCKENRTKWRLIQSMKNHNRNDLHIWCCAHEQKVNEEKFDFEEKNKEAGMTVIRNVIKALKHGQSSVDFLADNNHSHLDAEGKNVTVATKNNSRDAFFKIRDIVFEAVSEKTKKWFSQGGGGEIEDIAVTLDKVTVQRISYTCLLTYYFHNGVIYCFLNKLMIIGEDDYDSPGTARAVVEALMETLGLTKTRLSNLLRHFVYDGVYATTEQRVSGGGSLNLIKFVAEELGLDVGDITGTWDIAHQLQLIWKKIISNKVKVDKVIKIYFNAMSDFSLGKASTIFYNRARELGNLVLTPKKQQATRFVRSLIRGLRSAMQNLPTMVSIFAEEYRVAAIEMRNTEAKEYEQKMEDLRSSENFVLVLGILQLLELYATVSLDAQHCKYFPSQVWSSIKNAQSQLEALSQEWKWGEERLKFSVMDSPKVIVETLVSESRYEPKLLQNNVVRKGHELREAGILGEEDKVSCLFEDDEQVCALAGEVYMKEITSEKVSEIEGELSKIARAICAEWKRRCIQTEMEKAVCDLLGKEVFQHYLEEEISGEVEEVSDEVEENEFNVESIRSTRVNKQLMMEKLECLINHLPQYQRDRFDPIEIFPGLVSWLGFYSDLRNVPQNEVYSAWYRKFVKKDGSPECNEKFAQLFQNLQIRSCSEAIAETVGSIMSNHIGKGR